MQMIDRVNPHERNGKKKRELELVPFFPLVGKKGLILNQNIVRIKGLMLYTLTT